MNTVDSALSTYAREVRRLAAATGTTEPTFYPAIAELLRTILAAREMPFSIRTQTSQERSGAIAGVDQPDLAFYDGDDDFVTLFGEVKLPDIDLSTLSGSTERKNQVGRYLKQTRAVLLCNVRGFALLTASAAWDGHGAVDPADRELIDQVLLWPSLAAFRSGQPITPGQAERLADLVEDAVTRFAPIAEAPSLARILARQAKRAKDALPAKLTGHVAPLLEDFAKALGVHFEGDEGEEFLRSSLIQTVFYAVFAGWALWARRPRSDAFRWSEIGRYLRIPFLAGLFHELQHPKVLKELGLRPHLDLAERTLARVDIDRFFRTFHAARLLQSDHAAPTTQAITYFYEPFLEAFDPKLRKKLGVWYTPSEIVRYQVRKVDRLLREELSCERGLADDGVVVLDPCCGTGAYLIEVLRCIAEQLRSEGKGAALGAHLLRAASERVIGFELLTAPFVVAQLQLYLILVDEFGLEPGEDHRPAVYLTNALTGWKGSEQLKLHFPDLKEEHAAARRVKTEVRIIVVLGNPPYNRFAGVPIDEEADLVDHYKGIRRDKNGRQIGKSALYTRFGVRKHLLDDLYIRFFRLAEERIAEKAQYGLVSFISNSSYLSGRSHPLMRESLLGSFSDIWVDNLHGNRIASERTPWGQSCETIFSASEIGPGIKVGTAITTMLKRKTPGTGRQKQPRLHLRDFWGRAADKRRALLESLAVESWPRKRRTEAESRPEGPRSYEAHSTDESRRFRFVSSATGAGYDDWPALDELFPVYYQGVNPNRGLDGSLIDPDADALARRMRDYYGEVPWAELQKRYPTLCEDRARYDAASVRQRLRRSSRFRKEHIVEYSLFPLDSRFIYYETEEKLLNERRPELWEHKADNEFLIAVPQPRRPSESRPLMATSLFDLHLHDRGSIGFPSWVKKPHENGELFAAVKGRAAEPDIAGNLAPEVFAALKDAWSVRGEIGSATGLKLVRDLFALVLSIAHAPAYEMDQRESLSQDWAHIPIPRDKRLFSRAAELGNHVSCLIDPRMSPRRTIEATLGRTASRLAVPRKRDGGALTPSDLEVTFSYYGAATGRFEARDPQKDEPMHPAWGDKTGDLYLSEGVWLSHVPVRVFQHELGGYPVVKKWLGYRDAGRRGGQPLSLDELDHLRSIVHRLAALLALHPELDAVYEKIGGDAFDLVDLGLS